MSDTDKQTDNEQDFDSRADKLWSIYNREAESYDRALLEAWKGDMDSIIIFAGLFSAVLTAFLVDTTKRLKADPTDHTNALLNQAVVLLAQISQQLGPNGSQTIISLPQPLEPFQLNSSDLRINIFWYMSLGFSITAALGATLVQQWVRDYLQVFQKLSGSLERSRMRQYLFHGLSRNHMSILVECIPAFIHISLFLFFIGLAENLFVTNKAVGATMIVIMGFCVLFYFASSVFPVLYPQTPYHTPLSNVLWKMGQIIRPRKYSHRNTEGKIVSVSSDMANGRLQLAMGYSDNRMTRDTEAIHWVLTKITEDSQFEPFVAGIGGSLATVWGKDVWKSIFTRNEDPPGNMQSTQCSNEIASNTTVQALQTGFESLLHSWAVSTFSDQTRFARACVYIDAVASLTLGFKAELEFDIDNYLLNDVLQYFGDEKRRRDRPVQEAETSSGSATNLPQLSGYQVIDTSLKVKWKCLVLIGIRKALSQQTSSWRAFVMRDYERCVSSEEYRIYKDEAITSRAREVDCELFKAWNAARQLCSELCDIPEEQLTEERLPKELVPNWKGYIKVMQDSLYALNLRVHPSIDAAAVNLNDYLFQVTAAEHLVGISYEWPPMTTIRAMSGGIDWGKTPPESFKWFTPHLTPPRLLICYLLICADPRRRPNFDPSASRIDLAGLGRLLDNLEMRRLFDNQRAYEEGELERKGPQPYVNQLWRFKDISEHGGVGFMIELFFATFRSLDEKLLTDEAVQMIGTTLRAIIDNGKPEYFKTACRRFLWALRQEVNILWNDVVKGKQTSEETRTPPEWIIVMLRDLFDDWDRDKKKEKEEDKGGGERE